MNMRLNNLNDYYKYKMFIPVCEESISLDTSIKKYDKMKRARKALSKKNEYDLKMAYEHIEFNIKVLKGFLIKKGII